VQTYELPAGGQSAPRLTSGTAETHRGAKRYTRGTNSGVPDEVLSTEGAGNIERISKMKLTLLCDSAKESAITRKGERHPAFACGAAVWCA
jgi:hypothetical protein